MYVFDCCALKRSLSRAPELRHLGRLELYRDVKVYCGIAVSNGALINTRNDFVNP